MSSSSPSIPSTDPSIQNNHFISALAKLCMENDLFRQCVQDIINPVPNPSSDPLPRPIPPPVSLVRSPPTETFDLPSAPTDSHLDLSIRPDPSTSKGKEIIDLYDSDPMEAHEDNTSQVSPPPRRKGPRIHFGPDPHRPWISSRRSITSVGAGNPSNDLPSMDHRSSQKSSNRKPSLPAAFKLRGSGSVNSLLNSSTPLGSVSKFSASTGCKRSAGSSPPKGSDSLRAVMVQCLGDSFKVSDSAEKWMQLYKSLPFDNDCRLGQPHSTQRKACKYSKLCPCLKHCIHSSHHLFTFLFIHSYLLKDTQSLESEESG